MKIAVAGTRGIPNIQGGIETHCEQLYPRLVKLGVDVLLIRRRYYGRNNPAKEFNGVRLVDLRSSRKRSLESLQHTLSAILYARMKGYSTVHIHAIGPALAVPFARVMGMKVIVTHHGPDYDRQKWGYFAKKILRLGEWCAARFATEIIVISDTINTILKTKYNRHDAHLIHNGVTIPDKTTEDSYIRELGLQPGKYIIAVGRFVPEKGFHDLLNIVHQIHPSYKLVLVGDADHPSAYSNKLKADAASKGVVLTGFIKGDKLHQIFSHAALFVMPSYHEGLPIALLEALSYNLNTVVSDIPANLEVGLNPEHYYTIGHNSELADKINRQLTQNIDHQYGIFLAQKYNWDIIAKQTLAVYRRVMG